MDSRRRRVVLRRASVAAGCFGIAVANAVYTFGLYANAIKARFRYTQSEVELMGSMFNIGFSLSLPAGFIIEKFGTMVASLVALVLTSVGYFLLWSANTAQDFYRSHSGLQALYCFLAGLGATHLYMVSITTNIRNYDPRHRGRVAAMVETGGSLFPTIVSLLYGAFFINGHVTDEENQDVDGFLVLCGVLNALGASLAFVFVREFPQDDETVAILSAVEEDKDDNSVSALDYYREDVSGKALFKQLNFYFMFFGILLSGGVVILFINNTVVYLKAFHLEQYSTLINTIIPLSAAASKLGCGIGSDLVLAKIPRITFVLVAVALHACATTICIFASDQIGVLVFTAITTGLAFGVVYCICPIVTNELFGQKHFCSNWGILLFGNALGCYVFPMIFGALYDNSVMDTGDGIYCYGKACFTLSFTVGAVGMICSGVLFLAIFENTLHVLNLQTRSIKEIIAFEITTSSSGTELQAIQRD